MRTFCFFQQTLTSKEIYRISQKGVPLMSCIFLYYELSSSLKNGKRPWGNSLCHVKSVRKEFSETAKYFHKTMCYISFMCKSTAISGITILGTAVAISSRTGFPLGILLQRPSMKNPTLFSQDVVFKEQLLLNMPYCTQLL